MEYLRFWNQHLTCASASCSLAASSILSCTLRYFCRSKLFSRSCSCWSVNAVRGLRCFLFEQSLSGVPADLRSSKSSVTSSAVGVAAVVVLPTVKIKHTLCVYEKVHHRNGSKEAKRHKKMVYNLTRLLCHFRPSPSLAMWPIKWGLLLKDFEQGSYAHRRSCNRPLMLLGFSVFQSIEHD